jgi:tetratricopeptide (TPR) repeat protein
LHRNFVPAWAAALAQAREALANVPPEAERAQELAKAVVDRPDAPPDLLGEAHYLLGSAYLVAAAKASAERADGLWREARHHLEQAVIFHVPEADQARLSFRLGKAWFYTQQDPQLVIDNLSQSVEPGAEDPAEGYGLLAQAYLRLPTPNIQAALEANQKQLARTIGDEQATAPARLFRGELLVRADDFDAARQVLGRIDTSAPPAVYARARVIMADCCQKSQAWAEAVQLWEEVVKKSLERTEERGRALYSLGLCYRQLGQLGPAERAWDQALATDSQTEQAAALGLAELRLLGANPASALEFLERCVRGVGSRKDFHNSLVSLSEAQARFEAACRFLQKASDFAASRRVARLYEAIAPDGVVAELSAEISIAWGEESLARSKAVAGTQATSMEAQAMTHFREAAGDYEALARQAAEIKERNKWLHLAVKSYVRARDQAPAIAGLNQLIKVEKDQQALGEMWYELAQCYVAIQDKAHAHDAYVQCIAFTGPFAFRARYQVAQDDLAAGKWEDAEEILKQNLDLMRGGSDEAAYQQSLLALAHLLVRRENYRLAALRLQEALERYPGDAGSQQTRLELADCYRHLAAQEDQKLRGGAYLTEESQLHYREQRRLWMQMAAVHYHKLIDDLSARTSAEPLTRLEQSILGKAHFADAECRFELGDFQGAIRLYEQLVLRYPHKVETLRALKQITRCYWVLRNQKMAIETVKRLRANLEQLPESVFADKDGETRQEWQEWLAWAEKQ